MSTLEPINEPLHQTMQGAATNTTDMAAQEGTAAGLGRSEAPRVHKAQINALAKMLFTLRQ